MIIFDLDGTLANCEHRRHFVDRSKATGLRNCDNRCGTSNAILDCNCSWQPNWPAYYEACDKDESIMPVIHMLEYIGEGKEYGCDTPWVDYEGIQIWSGRCESVKKKTEKWLAKHVKYFHENSPILKMRPIGDNTPDDDLKERWLNGRCADLITAQIEGKNPCRHDINFVFDANPKSIMMWQRRGIFVFNCLQYGPGQPR